MEAQIKAYEKLPAFTEIDVAHSFRKKHFRPGTGSFPARKKFQNFEQSTTKHNCEE